MLLTEQTLFNESNILEYLRNLDNIQITLDGVKDVNDKLRIYPDGKGSFDDIMKSIKLIKKHKTQEIKCNICLRINVDSHSVDRAKELVNFLVKEELTDAITFVKFHEIFATQSEIMSDGTDIKDNNLELAKKISDLNFYLIEKGIKVFKDLGGPCIGKMANGFTVDEELNLYSCPGLLYSDIQGRVLNEDLEIIDNQRWYDYYLEESKCIETCNYAPICYGGCTWAKGKNEKDCIKNIYDETLVDKLKAYIVSHYM